MDNQTFSKLLKVVKRSKYIFLGGFLLTLFFIFTAFYLYYGLDTTPDKKEYWDKIAEFLLNIGESLLGTIVLGGGIGVVLNSVLAKIESEENDIKDQLKGRQEQQEKNKKFRWEMLNKLQEVHDHVELARVLIKSHKSGKTYGEQIRNLIMPSMIGLQEFKRRLTYTEDRSLIKNIDYLNVSLTYMIAYLSVLMEEFEGSYLRISNLQNYQDTIDEHRRAIFTATKLETLPTVSTKEQSTNTPLNLQPDEVPAKTDTVWQELEKLYYLSDFIKGLPNDKGEESYLNKFFHLHYYHCLKMLKSQNSLYNKKLTNKQAFQDNLAQLKHIEEIKESDHHLTKKDSLIRKIIVEELHFDFEIKGRSLPRK